jgi:nitric oxide reductase NorD protein
MPEAEDLLVEAALRTTIAARELWRRHTPRAGPLTLSAVQFRIELFVTALHGRCPPIVPTEPALPRTLLRALMQRRSAPLAVHRALAGSDGVRMNLPRTLDPSRGDAGDLALLRLLALEMAARIERGTVWSLPDDPLTRDLYLLAEASAIDVQLARELPGLAPQLARERACALAARPTEQRLSARERAVERLVQRVLSSSLTVLPLVVANTPRESLSWARRCADTLAAMGGSYRGAAQVPLWGSVEPTRISSPRELAAPAQQATLARRAVQLSRTPRARTDPETTDERPGPFVVKPDASQQSVEDPHGLSRPADRELAPDLDDIAAAMAELPEAQLVRSQALVRETLLAGALPPRAAGRSRISPPSGYLYPEWDCSAAAYRPAGAVVREPPAVLGDAAFSRAVLCRHAGLVREIRLRFERLRLRRQRFTRQPDGADVDIAAYVNGYADRRAGCAFDDRIYEASRRMRRELAACVLLDASASTDSWVSGQKRVIDIEKEALLVVAEAFELIADHYALLSFSGEGADGVEVVRLKSFEERSDELMRRRIAGLEPDRYTRAGAALRHATALLSKQPARHRLLLVLSDGKPNDVDEYEGAYGVEDVRKASIEARLAGIHVFCLAVDRRAPLYAARIFGARGFAVLDRPERLPRGLVELLRQLVTS